MKTRLPLWIFTLWVLSRWRWSTLEVIALSSLRCCGKAVIILLNQECYRGFHYLGGASRWVICRRRWCSTLSTAHEFPVSFSSSCRLWLQGGLSTILLSSYPFQGLVYRFSFRWCGLCFRYPLVLQLSSLADTEILVFFKSHPLSLSSWGRWMELQLLVFCNVASVSHSSAIWDLLISIGSVLTCFVQVVRGFD